MNVRSGTVLWAQLGVLRGRKAGFHPTQRYTGGSPPVTLVRCVGAAAGPRTHQGDGTAENRAGEAWRRRRLPVLREIRRTAT